MSYVRVHRRVIRSLWVLALALGLTAQRSSTPASLASPGPDRPSASHVVEMYGRLPLAFEANRGQTDHQVDFVSHGSGYRR